MFCGLDIYTETYNITVGHYFNRKPGGRKSKMKKIILVDIGIELETESKSSEAIEGIIRAEINEALDQLKERINQSAGIGGIGTVNGSSIHRITESEA